MQTILGSGGIMGIELAKSLKTFTSDIRLVSRNPQKVNKSDELMKADLLQADNAMKAVEGSSVVYVTVGFPYDTKIWQEYWPKFMTNVIEACKAHSARLVFFDNVYMYDRNHLDKMTEKTPVNPSSRKGEVRAKIARMIMDEAEKGRLTALIARSADFYGPGIEKNSGLTEMIFKPLSNGKKANWMCSVNYRHSFSYTPDLGKATAILGNTDDAYNDIWHLPTAPDPPTGKEWIEMIANEMGAEAKYQVLPKFMMGIIGLFMPIMKELAEMAYQFDRDYIFDSSKFEKRFDYTPAEYQEGIREVVERDYR